MPIIDKLGNNSAPISLEDTAKNLIAQGYSPDVVNAAMSSAKTPEDLTAQVTSKAPSVASAVDSNKPMQPAAPASSDTTNTVLRSLSPLNWIKGAGEISGRATQGVESGLKSVGSWLAKPADQALGLAPTPKQTKPSTVQPAEKKEQLPSEVPAAPGPATPAGDEAKNTLEGLARTDKLMPMDKQTIPSYVDAALTSWVGEEKAWLKAHPVEGLDPSEFDAKRQVAMDWYEQEKKRLDTKELFMGLGRVVALLSAGGVFGKGTGAGLSAPNVEQATRFDINPERKLAQEEAQTRLGTVDRQQQFAGKEVDAKRQTWAERMRGALGAQERLGQQAASQAQDQARSNLDVAKENATIDYRNKELDIRKDLGEGRNAAAASKTAFKSQADSEKAVNALDKQFKSDLSNFEMAMTAKPKEKAAALARAKAAYLTYVPGTDPTELDKQLDSWFGKKEKINEVMNELRAAAEQKKASMRQAYATPQQQGSTQTPMAPATSGQPERKTLADGRVVERIGNGQWKVVK